MYCTHCGVELKDQDKFCSQCGANAGRGGPEIRPASQLVRLPQEGKIAGVCAGFARYFDVDVTLVRVLWLVLTICPLPLFGVVAYIVAWMVMPKEPSRVPAVQMHVANG